MFITEIGTHVLSREASGDVTLRERHAFPGEAPRTTRIENADRGRVADFLLPDHEVLILRAYRRCVDASCRLEREPDERAREELRQELYHRVQRLRALVVEPFE